MLPHANQSVEKRFILSLSLTALILVAEIVGGIWTGSLALLSDAAHVFTDIFALAMSYLALRLSALPPDDKHTFGWHRLEVLAALANGVTLVVIALGIWYEAYQRWFQPGEVRSVEMLIIAVLGLVVNLVVAFVLGGHLDIHNHDDGTTGEHEDKPHTLSDLNLQSAFLHVVGDTVSSVGVILAAVIIWRTGWFWVDPLTSVLIGGLILFSSLRLTRSALHILVEGTPSGLSLSQVLKVIIDAPGVSAVHDLHVWSICSGHIALSAHVVLNESDTNHQEMVMSNLKQRLSGRFGIEHTTIQFEMVPCAQQADCSPPV